MRRYNRYLKKLYGESSPVDQKVILPASNDSVVRWSGVVASWSQIVMLIVVVFGYIYTVRPVFQKELISEDLARLQIEKNKWEGEISGQKIELEKRVNKIAEMDVELALLSKAKKNLEQSQLQAEKELNLALKKSKEAQKKLSASNAAYTDSVQRLVQLRKSEVTGSGKVSEPIRNVINKTFSGEIFIADKKLQIADGLKSTYLDPLKAVELQLSELERGVLSASPGAASVVEKQLLSEYKAGLSLREKYLLCPVPDFNSWQDSFVKALSKIDSNIQYCEDMRFENLRAEQGWSKKELENFRGGKQGDEYQASYAVACKTYLPMAVTKYFTEAWNKFEEPCVVRYVSVGDIVLGGKSVELLPPVMPFIPPSVSEVDSAIKGFIDRW